MSEETPTPIDPDSKSDGLVKPQSLQGLHKSMVFARKPGKATIEELIETLRPTVDSFMMKHDIRAVAMSFVAADGSSSSISFTAPDPENMDDEEKSEWEIQKNQAYFVLALEFAKAKSYMEQLLKDVISGG
jgi:hypothetical protein